MNKKETPRLTSLVLPYPTATNEFCIFIQLEPTVVHCTTFRLANVSCFFLIGCKSKLPVRSMLIDVVDRITNTVKVADRGPSV